MKNTTSRVLIASLLLTPAMLMAKPEKKKKKKKAKPVAEETAPTEDLNDPAPATTTEVADSSSAPSYNAGYGMAGCGFGQYVFKEDSIVQIFAATTNGTVYNQLFGISFETIGCTPDGKAVAQEQKVFIDANLVSLKREAASGQGETLLAFADLLGCDAAQFSQVSKSNYGEIYKASEADGILQGYKAVLNNQCSRLI